MNVRRGFTVVELLIVIVVIAILAAITIVAFTGIRERAKSTAFIAAVDSFEKEAQLYKARTGGFYEATRGTGYELPVYTAPQPGHRIGTSSVCFPGDYPAEGDFAAGECFVQYVSYAYVDEPSNSMLEGSVYNVDPALNQQFRDGTLATSTTLPDVPLYSGFRWSYSIELDVTQEEAEQISGLPNPRAGRIGVKALSAFRGIAIFGASPNDTSSAYMMYRLKGDQRCGRGTKTTVNIGDQLRDMASQLPDLVYETSSQVITECFVMMN